MKRYRIIASTEYVAFVEAENEDEAIELACEEAAHKASPGLDDWLVRMDDINSVTLLGENYEHANS